MSYLLDAHALLWHRSGDLRLPVRVRDLLATASAEFYISDATWWELIVKQSLDKLALVGGVESLRIDWIGGNVAIPLAIGWTHIRRLDELPWLHRDPFDRMLVAQALQERLVVITGDRQIHQYPGIEIFW